MRLRTFLQLSEPAKKNLVWELAAAMSSAHYEAAARRRERFDLPSAWNAGTAGPRGPTHFERRLESPAAKPGLLVSDGTVDGIGVAVAMVS
jgi:hypothetical protein